MTEDGLKAINTLSKEGIKTNCTLIFSVSQGLMAAKGGFEITHADDFNSLMSQFAQTDFLKASGDAAGRFVAGFTGATDKVLSHL